MTNNRETYYYDEDFYAFAGHKQKPDDHMVKRISGTVSKVPAEVQSILELGCGNGEVTNLLSDKFNIVGIDISMDRLRHVNAKKVKASIAQVPFKNSLFDLILCVSVLEHLSDDIFRAAIKEITRLSRKYILITIPDDENMNLKLVRCPECNAVFHTHGHFQSFSGERVKKLFPNFKLISLSTVAKVKARVYSPLLLKLRQYIFNCWFYSEELLCPICHNTKFSKPPYIVFRMVSLINAIFHPLKKLQSGYLVALFLKS